MKSKFICLIIIFCFNMIYSQNGYIIKNNGDTIAVDMKIDGLNVRSFQTIEKLQSKVVYKINGEKFVSKPEELKGFCIKTDQRDFWFDTIDNKFLFRLVNDNLQSFKVYQIYGSSFFMMKYSSSLAYLIKKDNQPDYFFDISIAKRWRNELLEIVKDCPEIYTKFSNEVKKIQFEYEFESYLNEYIKNCRNNK